jgi:hypothetical protein
MSIDTLGGSSFDSEDDVNNIDGLAYAALAVKNSASTDQQG